MKSIAVIKFSTFTDSIEWLHWLRFVIQAVIISRIEKPNQVKKISLRKTFLLSTIQHNWLQLWSHSLEHEARPFKFSIFLLQDDSLLSKLIKSNIIYLVFVLPSQQPESKNLNVTFIDATNYITLVCRPLISITKLFPTRASKKKMIKSLMLYEFFERRKTKARPVIDEKYCLEKAARLKKKSYS